jgi:hypothetical protein
MQTVYRRFNAIRRFEYFDQTGTRLPSFPAQKVIALRIANEVE